MSRVVASSQILKLLSDATVEVVEKAAPSVVSVSFGMGRGSGVVWSSDGYIVTCSHVVGNRSVVKVGLGEESKFEAKVVGRDYHSDVAVLKVERGTFKPIEVGDSENLKVGQFVLGLANPFSRQLSATLGVITSVGGSLRSRRGMSMENIVVTDARLNPGYSGGPLVDVSGRMIGLNMAYVWSRGIAVPVSTVKSIANRLARGGKIKRAYLGITLNTIPLPREIATQPQISQDEGIIVLSVEADSSAKRAGLALGDVILKFDEKPVTSVYDLSKLLTEEVIGKETKLWILRGEKLMELTVTPRVARIGIKG